MTLRERAIEANRQRDEVCDQKRLLKLKEEIQRICGIAVEPTENHFRIEDWRFFMAMDGRDDVLHIAPQTGSYVGTNVRSLADVGDAILMYEAPPDEV